MPGVRFPVAEFFDTLAEWLRRQPAKLLGSARAGSNPAGVVGVPVAQWIRRETTNLKIAGSNPVGDIGESRRGYWFYSVIGYHSGL